MSHGQDSPKRPNRPGEQDQGTSADEQETGDAQQAGHSS